MKHGAEGGGRGTLLFRTGSGTGRCLVVESLPGMLMLEALGAILSTVAASGRGKTKTGFGSESSESEFPLCPSLSQMCL